MAGLGTGFYAPAWRGTLRVGTPEYAAKWGTPEGDADSTEAER